MRSPFNDSVLAWTLLILLVILTNPFDLFMPEAFMMICTALVVVFFVLFLWYLVREKAQDEREELHQYMAARYAYLAGAGILVLGTVLQVLTHALSLWLPSALGAMLLARITTRWYAERYH